MDGEIAVGAARDYVALDFGGRRFEGVGESCAHSGGHFPGYQRRKFVERGAGGGGEDIEEAARYGIWQGHREIIPGLG